MADFVTIDAAQLDTTSAYRLIIGCVTPRPIAWVTTISAEGKVNAAPFSSYNYVAHSPPMLAINIGKRDGQLKDTARNMIQTKEFVVNVPTESNMDLMHACGADYPAEVSEVEALGIALIPGVKVRVPRIAVTPVQMECRLVRALNLGRGLNTLYIGEVLAFHLSGEVYDGKHVDSARLRPIARLGGPNYATLGEIHTRPMLQKPPK